MGNYSAISCFRIRVISAASCGQEHALLHIVIIKTCSFIHFGISLLSQSSNVAYFAYAVEKKQRAPTN